jgi:iduronate 2-sulfatase
LKARQKNFAAFTLAVFAALSTASALSLVALAAPTNDRLNVLFIAVDDLKPALGCYGDQAARSPNIDRLAAEGVRFSSAYVQQSVCAASRSSMLTGLRPDTTGVTYGDVHFRTHVPDAVTLPEHFKRQGYFTQSIGKIFHGKLDDPRAWSVPSFSPTGLPGWGPEGKRIFAERQNSPAALASPAKKRADRFKGPAWEMAGSDDRDLPDGQIADRAIAALHEMGDRPFFLAVGFYKPHLPFVAPKKYWDLHDPQSLPIASNPALPTDAPAVTGHDSFELRKYHKLPPAR